MGGKRVRAIAGFALAPVSPFLLLGAIQAVGDVDTDLGVDRGLLVFFAYFWTTLIAIPAYCLIARHVAFRLPHAMVIGGIVGFMVWATVPMLPLVACIGLGLFAGITFWLIWYRKPSGTPPP
jgi:hypothetical protein